MIRPSLMITTRSVTGLTSCRMCVEKMIVFCAGQALDQVADADDLQGIQAAGGLVEDQDVRVVDQRLGQAGALLVALGQFADVLLVLGDQAAGLDAPVEALAQPVAGQAAGLADEGQVLVHVHVQVQGNIFGQVADPAPHGERLLQDIDPIHRDRARVGGQEGGDDLHGRALAGAVGAQEAEDLSPVEPERHVVERDAWSRSSW